MSEQPARQSAWRYKMTVTRTQTAEVEFTVLADYGKSLADPLSFALGVIKDADWQDIDHTATAMDRERGDVLGIEWERSDA